MFFDLAGGPGQEVHERLVRLVGVNAPAGNFCAPGASRALGLGKMGVVRAGPALYSDDEDVERLLLGVAEVAE